ncbi:DUF4181 domain-containing protein [Domibacillus enclensis]|uniref:DUF4181 domain-containing protein n=1 Tax=Domibacillus enclensis TaxID=1017273 RepID=A0A1N6Y7P4_9BACI|nr:DUF4181 domain-containing protein [Domibacillus enclensis]OXS77543.1 hypothetical protein B1B05_11955 [Domibacillus enclensis]SIR10501.1 protein of unknown function [Domibacillus enclensis]
MLFLFIVLAIAGGIFLERGVRAYFAIPKLKGIFYKHVNETHRWTEGIAMVLSFVIGFILLDQFPRFLSISFLIPMYIAIYSTRTYFEWKYAKEQRQYILSFFILVYVLVVILLLIGPLHPIFK